MQALRYRLVGASLRHESQDFALPFGQLLDRTLGASAADQSSHNLWVDDRAALVHARQCVNELIGILHAILQQIADASLRARDQICCKGRVQIGGEHEHADGRPAPVNLAGRSQALVGPGWRHPDVDDYYVGLIGGDEVDELHPVAGLSGHRDPRLLQKPDEPGSKEGRVVGDGYAHGMRARTAVPPPGGLHISTSPPSTDTRSVMPTSPVPRSALAPPTPSSLTSTTRQPPSRSTEISTRRAEECLAALASASLTTK